MFRSLAVLCLIAGCTHSDPKPEAPKQAHMAATVGALNPDALSRYLSYRHAPIPDDKEAERLFREAIDAGEFARIGPAVVEVLERRPDRTLVRLPDGRTWWVADDALGD